MNFKLLSRALLAGAAMLPLSGTAFALDGADLLAKLNAAYGNQGGTISAASVDVDGETVTLKDTRFALKDKASVDFPVGDVTLEGVEEDEGGYTIETMSIPDIHYNENQLKFSAADLVVSGVRVPADANAEGLGGFLLYDEARSGAVIVEAEGKQVFSAKETKTTLDVAEDEDAIGFDLELLGLNADLSGTQDPATLEAINKLGLNKVSGKINISGDWEAEKGTVDITQYAIDLDDVGKLDITLSFSGYTLDFMKAMQETTKQAAANPNPEEAQQAAGFAMLGLAQQLNFNSMQIRFDDAGITKRGLDYAGAQQGVSGEQMGQALKAMTPMVVAQWNIPTLQNAISTAVSTFIDKPGNVTIKAAPKEPVAFPMIVGAAMGAPNTLPELLDVTVTAND